MAENVVVCLSDYLSFTVNGRSTHGSPYKKLPKTVSNLTVKQ